MITGSVIDGELAPPAVVSGGSGHQSSIILAAPSRCICRRISQVFRTASRRRGSTTAFSGRSRSPLLTAALAATRGNQIRAADLLGLNRNTLRKKIRDLDIQVYRTGG